MMDGYTTFDWNDDIKEDGMEPHPLLPGTYQFKVTGFERKTYSGNSASIPNGCKYADITLQFTDGTTGATTLISDKLYLMKKFEWKLGAFMNTVGLKAKGEPVSLAKMPQCVGKTGTAKVGCKSDKSEDYARLTAEEAAVYIKSGKTVFNEILSYVTKKDGETSKPDTSTISPDQFGFKF